MIPIGNVVGAHDSTRRIAWGGRIYSDGLLRPVSWTRGRIYHGMWGTAGYTRLYMNGGGSASHDQSVGLLAGTALGGGTVINYTTSFRTPDDVRQEWASHGVGAFTTEEYGKSLDAVVERLGVNHEHSRPSARDEVMQRGLGELGWHVDRMPRNVRGCDQGEVCGYCGFGCRLGAKQSTVKTWLLDAHQAICKGG